MPYEVEKIEYREVQVPVERVVDKVVEVPYDKVVFHDKVVYQDKGKCLSTKCQSLDPYLKAHSCDPEPCTLRLEPRLVMCYSTTILLRDLVTLSPFLRTSLFFCHIPLSARET